MIVVSDTTPLNYLVLIEAVEVLPRLFGKVFAPPAVIDELRHSGSPDVVRTWAASPPSWLNVEPPRMVRPLQLDAGETEALSLAMELGADLVLIDEQAGRQVAIALGLLPRGTIGVLGLAADVGLLDASNMVDRLQRTHFRGPPSLLAALRKRGKKPNG